MFAGRGGLVQTSPPFGTIPRLRVSDSTSLVLTLALAAAPGLPQVSRRFLMVESHEPPADPRFVPRDRIHHSAEEEASQATPPYRYHDLCRLLENVGYWSAAEKHPCEGTPFRRQPTETKTTTLRVAFHSRY